MRITVIGAGNVGTRLGAALHTAGHKIVQVYSRDIARANALASHIGAEAVSSLGNMDSSAEVILIAVNDDAISSVYAAICDQIKAATVVHTAGSVSTSVFAGHGQYGVVWPVQSLSAAFYTDLRNVPLAISANTPETLVQIASLARSISDHVYEISDVQREYLHLAATFANNFSNHMYAIAKELTDAHEIPFEILKPLILGTAQKVQQMDPAEAQTGPAVRGDKGTMMRHLELLRDRPDVQELYLTMTRNIMDSYGQERV